MTERLPNYEIWPECEQRSMLRELRTRRAAANLDLMFERRRQAEATDAGWMMLAEAHAQHVAFLKSQVQRCADCIAQLEALLKPGADVVPDRVPDAQPVG